MQVVDAQAGQCRHQVLDGGNAHVALLQHRRHARVAHADGRGRQVHDLGQVDAVEDNAGIRLGRTQGEFDPATRMDAHAYRAYEILNTALSEHDDSIILAKAGNLPIDTGITGLL